MKQRRNYSSSRSYRKPRSNGDHSYRSHDQGAVAGQDRPERHAGVFDPQFPSATLLQEYEYATDGAANRLLDMAKEEQRQRFAREAAEDLFNKKTIRISQFFGFVAFLVILIETCILIADGKEQMAMVLFFGALGTGLVAALISACTTRSPSVRPPAAPAKPKHEARPAVVHSTPAITNASQSQPAAVSQDRRQQNGNGNGNQGANHRHGDNRRRNDRNRNRRRTPRPEGATTSRPPENRQGQ